MKIGKNFFSILFLLCFLCSYGQETLPIYTDYLSDNVFLVHPSSAGFRDCSKVRLTARNQWSGVKDAPALQTLSFHTKIGDKMGVGAIIFNDKNGYHSQKGFQATYAYHLELGEVVDYRELSFGISAMFVNNTLDESSFNIPDPVISQIVQSEKYFNADVSLAYHDNDLFGYVTVKNLLLSARNLYNSDYESLNLRRYLMSAGYYFDYFRNGSKFLEFEPSVMVQFIERTSEVFVDFNFKAYKEIDNAKLWAAFSYRRGFDNSVTEKLNYLTPIIGVNFEKYMISYTYTKQSGEILFDDAGYHQITLGFNFGCDSSKRFWNERGGKSNRMF